MSTYTATSTTGQTFTKVSKRVIEFAVISRVVDLSAGQAMGGSAKPVGTEALFTTGKLSTCEKAVKDFSANTRYAFEIVPVTVS